MSLPDDPAEFLDATRELIRQARALLDSGEVPRAGTRAGVLGLYESLCRALDGIDAARVHVLLGRIAQQVEQLNALAGDVECLRRLRQGIRAS